MLRALAGRCERVDVLALAEGRHDLPANVEVRTFGAPTRAGRTIGFVRRLTWALARRPDAVLAHMGAVYAIAAAPLARPLRVPVLLWWTHWSVTRSLRLATVLSSRVLSVDAASFPLESPKLRALGHGVDVEAFAHVPGRGEGPPLELLVLGRLARTKGLEVVLDGFEAAVGEGLDAMLELRGPAATAAEEAYRATIERRIAERPLAGRVRMEPPLPWSAVPSLLGRFDALLNAHAGTLDKVVYEAAAAELPVLACSPGFDGLLRDLPVDGRFRCDDVDGLKLRLLDFARSSREARRAAGGELRRRVVAAHSTQTWADGIVAAVAELRA
jgi:glycosyltransferase involved in cell wall biosynthesis